MRVHPLAESFTGAPRQAVSALCRISAWMAERGWVAAMDPALEAAIADEMRRARAALAKHDFELAGHHAGRVHILGSYFFVPHAFVHATHLKIGLAKKDVRSAWIQLVRLAGTPGTRVFTPYFGSTGHPGSSDRKIGSRWPIPPELQVLLDRQPRVRRRMPQWIARFF